jgi:hypothetical protein
MKALDSGRITGRMAVAGARRCAFRHVNSDAICVSLTLRGRAWRRCFDLASRRPGAAAVD